MNARKEILNHVGKREVLYVHIRYDRYFKEENIKGTLEEVLPLLNFEYDNGFGGQELFGTIWYKDGTWSERGEYDGSEWWDYKSPPELPSPD